MKKIYLIVGARPNFMKAFPIYNALKNDFELKLIHTGQHFDEKMSKIFFEQLGFPKPDIHFELHEKSRAGEIENKLYIDNNKYLNNKDEVIFDLLTLSNIGQISEIRDNLHKIFYDDQPDLIIIFGDVTSTLSAALAAYKLGIQIAHIEAGLRSNDLSMPEEVNRILTDYISTYFFVTEQSGINNLNNEGFNNNIYLVGNTMIECLEYFKNKALETKSNINLGYQNKDYVLVTLHRPSNVDNIEELKIIINDLNKLYDNIIFPVHPRTKKNLEKLNVSKNILLCEPQGYLEFICLEINAKYIITDSGGIQEESTHLSVPCFTLRNNTERPITLIENGGTNQLIKKIENLLITQFPKNNIWDNLSSMRIKNILIENINN
jgi:UDP-N-acetylglucosamine 2-epimerase (non-hydrolysing)